MLCGIRKCSAYRSIERKTHLVHCFEGSGIVAYVTAHILGVSDHWTKYLDRESDVSERHETNDVISFTHVDAKFSEQHVIV